MHRAALRALAVILGSFVSGIIGLIIGAFIGGNYARQFLFNGVRGYEAAGQLGFIIGALMGIISGWLLLFKRKS